MTILDTIKEMLTSKKFLASIAGVIVAAAARIGLELDANVVIELLIPIVGYVVSQGWADSGKEAAKIEQETEKIKLEIAKLEAQKTTPSPTNVA